MKMVGGEMFIGSDSCRAITLPLHPWRICQLAGGKQVGGLRRIVRKFLYNVTTVKALWLSSRRNFPRNWKVEYVPERFISTYRGYFLGYLRFVIELQRKRYLRFDLIDNVSFILLISHALYLQVFHIGSVVMKTYLSVV